MQKYKSTDLLDQLQSDVRLLILRANQLRKTDPGLILQQPAPGKWSVTEVLEHLNSYSRFYLVAIEKSLKQEKPAVEFFRPGWLGDYFTKLMKPSDDGLVKHKMKSPKDHRPPKFLDASPVITTFLEHQQYLLDLLELAKSKDIGSIRCPISISKLVKLKVGDVFRFLVAHEQRHFIQIENALTAVCSIRPGRFPTILPVM